jgi:hypothetical protein
MGAVRKRRGVQREGVGTVSEEMPERNSIDLELNARHCRASVGSIHDYIDRACQCLSCGGSRNAYCRRSRIRRRRRVAVGCAEGGQLHNPSAIGGYGCSAGIRPDRGDYPVFRYVAIGTNHPLGEIWARTGCSLLHYIRGHQQVHGVGSRRGIRDTYKAGPKRGGGYIEWIDRIKSAILQNAYVRELCCRCERHGHCISGSCRGNVISVIDALG